MAIYAITFRISSDTVGGKSYAERRQRLIDNVRSDGLGFWDATTSFFLVEAAETTYRFAERACRGLSRSHDMVVVFDPDDMSMVHFGPVPDEDVLGAFFRFKKKLL